ncbi:p-loop containing nucleoside triphosphate hydrolase protein [Venustampulla echinocandica]|uniref:ATP-dependent DNA helicase n=1 Tax=Venustampulla echinocandica TaxID=2656787 RepID=A0A370TM80_9HELO|nr:p-loop containing nucleoside triphosphate hydrolase protein [Venustampulla echinocandica]RDL36629.1 p-loop containing nucleoside triphosphate hydrolase protein [Venustampulla echinocandica]
MDEEDYGDIADEDLIEVFSQHSQSLPSEPRSNKRRRISYDTDDGDSTTHRRQSRDSIVDSGSGDDDEVNTKSRKKKYRIHIGAEEVSARQILGATQAEALPDSSPYRIRGPIYKKPRTEAPKPPVFFRTPQRFISRSNSFQDQINDTSRDEELARELADLPSDAFSSPENDQRSKEPVTIGSSPPRDSQPSSTARQRIISRQNSFRQTTLFGGQAPVSASQPKKVQNYIVDLPPEAPTHHTLDREALKTWDYPANLGATRDYQFSIVKNGLFNNLLVALPTGLGKTFIAATIMLNYFRWTKDAQIVFVAPTKPLVAQQAEACFNIVGIPKSKTTMLTGGQPPVLRAEQWAKKRVFFMTPQTLENDLTSGIADPKKIVLLVVDEAHRATGNYAYVKVVKFMRRFNKSFRILALTATPGASVEAVQEVVNNLEISKVEIRTEESIDIQQYVHRRNIEQIVLDPSDEMIMVKDLFSKALQPLVNQLCAQNAYYNKDPMSLTPYGLMQAKITWLKSDVGRRASAGLKGMMNGLFAILASVAHGIKLLNFHGIGPFFSTIKEFRTGVEDGTKGGKYRTQIVQSPDFKNMMNRIQSWINTEDFIGHPKLTFLCDTILNHFLDAGDGQLGEDTPPSSTRVIVFAEYRDSAEDICRVLNKHGPMLRASVFVGQADSKRSEGMNQAKQLETIENFKSGKLNVIVATSIGEEGLDIGQVDLIVCYDASSSPIRMLQRMGRTGRKRAGNIVLLLMRGKEEDSFTKAKDNYEKMQQMISSGTRFNFRHDLSVRIIPRDINPIVDKRIIEIPLENTQDPSLPEPKRRSTKGKKMPPKKFHMPDGVETGFRKASKISGEGLALTEFGITVRKSKESEIECAPIPPLESVLLSPEDMRELHRRYLRVAYSTDSDILEVTIPDMTMQPVAQRSLSVTAKVAHGQYTKRCVSLFRTLANSQNVEDRFIKPYGDEEPSQNLLDLPTLNRETMDLVEVDLLAKKQPMPRAKQLQYSRMIMSDLETDEEATPTRHHTSSRDLVSGDDSEGEGDSLIDSEERSDDSDALVPQSMQDFIVEEEEISSSSRRTSGLTRSSSPPPLESPKQTPTFLPSEFPDTECTDDDDLPDIPDPVGFPSRHSAVTSVPDLSSEGHVWARSNPRTKGRRVVVLDDSDE